MPRFRVINKCMVAILHITFSDGFVRRETKEAQHLHLYG